VVADVNNERVRVVAVSASNPGYTLAGCPGTCTWAQGDIYTVAGNGTQGYGGDGGLATAAELYGPQGFAVDPSGNLVIADSYNNRVRVVAVSASDPGYLLAGCPGTCTWAQGDIYTVAGNGTQGYGGDGGPATSAELSEPSGIAVDPNGNLVIADRANCRFREVLVRSSSTPDHLALSPASATVTAGDTQAYSAEGFDASGNDLGDVTSATTFAMSGAGSCTGASCSATVPGTYTVTGTDGSATGTATLQVTAPSGDWPQFRGGPTHTGYNAAETTLSPSNVADLGVAWTATTGTPRYASATVADGVVYSGTSYFAGGSGGKLYAFAVGCASGGGTCSPIWTADIGAGTNEATPAVADGVVYVASAGASGALYAFAVNCASGGATCLPLWTATTGDVRSSPTVADGVVYITSYGTGEVYAFAVNCASGGGTCSPLWTSPYLGMATRSSPAVADGVVYVGGFDGNIYAFPVGCRTDGGTCSPLWTAATGSYVNSSPAVSGGAVYVGSDDGNLYAFPVGCRTDGGACAPLWTGSTGGSVDSSPAIANGAVYIASASGNLYAFPVGCRTDGGACSPLWTGTIGDVLSSINSSPTVANGVVYVGSQDGDLYAFAAGCRSDGGTCSPLWTATTNGQVLASPTVSGGVVYIQSYDGNLYALGLLPPGTLDHLALSPPSATITPGAKQTYTAEGLDGYGKGLGDVTTATTFTISGGGTCVGTSCGAAVAGTYTVTGSDGTATGTATLVVAATAATSVAISFADSMPSISAGYYHACAISPGGTLTCWGDGRDSMGGMDVPSGTYIAVGAGWYDTCAIRADGRLACWGDDSDGQLAVPSGTFTTLSSGMAHTCAIRTDGTLACWGYDVQGEATAPAGTFTAVAAGVLNTCAIRTDGTLACWGDDSDGQLAVPSGTFTALATGDDTSCAIRTDGTLACWGDNTYGQAVPPSGTFTEVGSGIDNSCAIRTDGTLACWGDNGRGQLNAPAGTYKALTVGAFFACAINTDNTLACWGYNGGGQASPPAGSFGDTVAGFPGTLTVTALDSYGNVATGYSGTVHFTSSDAAAVLPPDYTFTAVDSGAHAFDVTFKSAGAQSLTVTDGTATGATTLQVIPGFLDHMVLSPASATVTTGHGQAYTAEGFDASGNDLGDVTSATTFTISGGGSCTGALCTTTVPGTYTVTGTDGATTGTATLQVNPSPITVTVSGSQTYGSSSPAYIPTYSAPSGVQVSGIATCTTVNGGTSIGPSLSAGGTYVIDGASCSGLSAPVGYSVAYVGGSFTVDQATPTVSWPTPSAVTNGTALGSAQLDATASVPGSFSYSPAAGTVLSAGANQTLGVTFTPTDTTDYTTASATTTITVLPVGWTVATVVDSNANPLSGVPIKFTSATGVVTNLTTGTNGTASAALAPGKYTVTATYANGYQTQGLTVTANGPNTVSFATVAVTVQVDDPTSSDLASASVAQAGNTGTFGPKTAVSSAGQVVFQVLPGTSSFTTYVAGGYQTQSVSVPSVGPFTVTFSTVAVTVQVDDPTSSDLASASVAHAGNTGTFGPKTAVNSTGQVVFQALPGTSSFTAYVAGGYQTQALAVTVSGPNAVTFSTVAVTVTVLKNGSPLLTASVAHAGNTGTFGPRTPVNSAGQVVFQALPGTSSFTAWDGGSYSTVTLGVSGAASTSISVS
jgi:outer membrane protein assembly factor BamB